MKDDGFLLIDSVISLKIMLIITTILVPTIIHLNHVDKQADNKLEMLRRLYIEIQNSEDQDDFLKNERYVIRGDEICEEAANICIKIK